MAAVSSAANSRSLAASISLVASAMAALRASAAAVATNRKGGSTMAAAISARVESGCALRPSGPSQPQTNAAAMPTQNSDSKVPPTSASMAKGLFFRRGIGAAAAIWLPTGSATLSSGTVFPKVLAMV